MPRFVILTHDHPFGHWDLMLETGESLRTWRLLQAPDSPGFIEAEALPDHRLHYLNYEGPLSGNRGEVKSWDQGSYTFLEETSTRVEFFLQGKRLVGRYVITGDSQEQMMFYSAGD